MSPKLLNKLMQSQDELSRNRSLGGMTDEAQESIVFGGPAGAASVAQSSRASGVCAPVGGGPTVAKARGEQKKIFRLYLAGPNKEEE